MIRSSIRANTYRAIYRLLDRVSPLPFDCGSICGAACCDITSAPCMGMTLLPGEDKVHDKKDPWLSWTALDTDEYDYPDSWQGKVFFVECRGAAFCKRKLRPIQCRSFPLSPHIDEAGELSLRFNDMSLPYSCPLIEAEARLDPRFVKATYTVWKHLIRDPLIYDYVRRESETGDGR